MRVGYVFIVENKNPFQKGTYRGEYYNQKHKSTPDNLRDLFLYALVYLAKLLTRFYIVFFVIIFSKKTSWKGSDSKLMYTLLTFNTY